MVFLTFPLLGQPGRRVLPLIVVLVVPHLSRLVVHKARVLTAPPLLGRVVHSVASPLTALQMGENT